MAPDDTVWASYPKGWPACLCGAPALDGHLTCGRADCNEALERAAHTMEPPTFVLHATTDNSVLFEWTPSPDLWIDLQACSLASGLSLIEIMERALGDFFRASGL